ncbi:hypothetical protein K0U27_02510 [archaeon]|nr:hypothetical protein [archaeon]
MKTSSLIIIVISIVIVTFLAVNFFMNLYHYGEYLRIDEGHVWHCSSDDKRSFCDNTSVRIMEQLGLLHDREHILIN